MKKWLIIIAIFVLLFILFKFVYFSTTEVKITDLDGNIISEANVRVDYSCQEAQPDVGGGEHFKRFGYREGITDNEGIVNFNSLNKGLIYNLPYFMFNCHKRIIASTGPLDKDYHPNSPFFNSKSISWNNKNVSLILKKMDNYSNTSCKFYFNACLNYEGFDNVVRSINVSACTNKFISFEDKEHLVVACNQGAFRTEQEPDEISLADCLERYRISGQLSWKELNTECYTEVAFAKKDPSICANVKDIYAQRICYEYLALELKDISLCKNAGNERVFEYCKFEVIKRIRDIEMCSQIDIKDIRSDCKVYLS